MCARTHIIYKYQGSSAFYENFFELLLGFKIYIKNCTFTEIDSLSENHTVHAINKYELSFRVTEVSTHFVREL